MRIRSYYSENEIIPNLYTFGSEWQTITGEEYKGLYHKYIPTGEIYTGGTWNQNTSEQLIEYKKIDKDVVIYHKLNSDIKIGTQSIFPLYTIKLTPEDYSRTYITRYFIKKVNEDIIYEVDDIQFYDQLGNIIDLHLYQGAAIDWYITGEISDKKDDTAITYGVISKNKKALKKAETKIPGITKLVTNLLQYYEDTDYIVPKNIN